MKIFDNLIRSSLTFKTLVNLANLTNTAVTSLSKLCETMATEIENQKVTIIALTKLCELLLQKDPQLQKLLIDGVPTPEKKKNVN